MPFCIASARPYFSRNARVGRKPPRAALCPFFSLSMPRLSFSGHETFPLRFSWLKKAVDAVERDAKVFSADEALATFGVGKNMVRAIKHWARATGVIENDSGERGAVQVTPFGRRLFGAEGADPFCEDPATLWVLHWHLCRTAGRSTLWHFVFGHWRSSSASGALELDALQPALRQWLADTHDDTPPAASTLRRDLRCLRACYAPDRSERSNLEDVVGCPLASLGLIQKTGGLYRLRQGHQTALPADIFAYVVLDYWRRRAPGSETLALQDLLSERASPGRILLVDEDQAFALIEEVEHQADAPFVYRDTAGIRQLYLQADSLDPAAALTRYYEANPELALAV
jgi:hypothetical protein